MAKWYLNGAVLAAVLALSVPIFAQKPANAPAGSTAQCSDGSFSTAKTERGACSKHGGVKAWFGPAAPATKQPAAKAPRTGAADNPRRTPTASAGGSTGAAPAGSTGQCSDGSYTRAKTQQGACSKHGGVKTWFAANSPAPPVKVSPNAAPPPAPRDTTSRSAPAPTPTAPAPRAPASSGKAPTVAPPPGTPNDATAKCKDSTYSFAKGHSGACSRHGGVAEWYK
jgi:hypothetical protein